MTKTTDQAQYLGFTIAEEEYARVHMGHLLGMGKAGKKFILLLDIDRILSVNELMGIAKLQDLPPGVAPAPAGAAV